METSHGCEAETEPPFPPRSGLLVCLALALVTFGVFTPLLQHDFVNYDDFAYITDNSHVRDGLTFSGIIWAFTSGYASNWHPLTWISHMLDCQVYGVNHPGGHHFTNVLFHIANTLLLFLMLRRMTGAFWRSAVVAALFAWHPLHVESVAWAAERKDVLSTFFWLLTMMAYQRYVEEFNASGPRVKRCYCVVLVLFALGLMSKPMVVTLPCVLLLVDYWPLGRSAPSGDRGTIVVRKVSWMRLIMEKLPMMGMSLIASFVTFVVQHSSGAMMPAERNPFNVRIGHALLAYIGYLKKMIWPSNLAIFYALPPLLSVQEVVAAGILLAMISGAAIALARRRPYVIFGWLWFLGTLVPVIGLVQVGAQAMADRYSYMPLVGLFIVIIWGLADLPGVGRFDMPKTAWAILLPVLAVCLALTWKQESYWKNTETLFYHDLAVTPDNFTAHWGLAQVLERSGRSAEAESEFNAAMQYEPNSPVVLNGFGIRLAKKGELSRAEEYYRSAMREDPAFSDAHYNLGNLLVREGRLDEAAAEYREAFRLKPDSPDAHNNLGGLLLRTNRPQDALAEFKAALRLQSNYPEAQVGMATALLQMGHADLAQIHYEEALRLKPDLAGVRSKLGLVLARQSLFNEAITQFLAAIKEAPQSPDNYFNLAAAYAAVGRFDDAIKTAEQVRELAVANHQQKLVDDASQRLELYRAHKAHE